MDTPTGNTDERRPQVQDINTTEKKNKEKNPSRQENNFDGRPPSEEHIKRLVWWLKRREYLAPKQSAPTECFGWYMCNFIWPNISNFFKAFLAS